MKSSLRRYSAALFCLCILASRACAGSVDEASQTKADDAAQERRLVDGVAIMKAGDPARALRDYFDPMIAANDQRIAAAGKKVYAARTPAESLAYLLPAANSHISAVVYSSQMAYAHFMKAYVLIELHRDQEAKPGLDAALLLSPLNAQILDEAGSWYQRQGLGSRFAKLPARAGCCAAGTRDFQEPGIIGRLARYRFCLCRAAPPCRRRAVIPQVS